MSLFNITIQPPDTITATVTNDGERISASVTTPAPITYTVSEPYVPIERSMYIRSSGGYIQWSYNLSGEWNNIITVAELQGPEGPQGDPGSPGASGREIELQKGATYLQYRYTGDSSWTDLVALADITGATGSKGETGDKGDKGDKGDTGDTGPQGIQGETGAKGDTGDTGPQGIQGETGDTGPAGEDGMSRFTFVLHRGENASVGVDKCNTLVIERACTILKAYAYAKTAPTGASLIFDININGSTIWATQSNRLQIAAGNTYGTADSFNTTALNEGDILTIDIDQTGTTTPGADITVVLKVV